jgi:hypothetical protein
MMRDSNPMKLIAWALISMVLTAHVTQAGFINARTPIIIETFNETTAQVEQFDATEMTVTYSGTDANLNTQLGQYYLVTRTLPPLYPFQVTARGRVPTDVYIYGIRTFQVDSGSVQVNLTITAFVPGGTGRRLLSMDTDTIGKISRHASNAARDALEKVLLDKQRASPTMRKLMSVEGSDVWECGFLGPLDQIGLFSLFDSDYDPCSDFNSPMVTLQNQLQAQIDLANAHQRWIDNATLLFQQQQQINQDVQANAQAVNRTLRLMQAQNVQLQLAQEAMAEHFDRVTALIQDDITSLSNNVASGMESLAAQDAFLGGRIVNVTISFAASLNGVVATQNEKNALTDRRLRDNIKFTRRVLTLLNNGPAGTNKYVSSLRLKQIWLAITDAVSRGRVPMVDPYQVGIPPTTSVTDAQKTGKVDFHYINFINNTELGFGGTTQLHQFGITTNCNLQALSKLGIEIATWEDIDELIGEPGCLSGYTSNENPVATCKCWVEVTHKYCTYPVGSTFTWESVTALGDRSAYQLKPSMCSGSIVDDPIWDGVRIDNLTRLDALVGSICRTRAFISGTDFLLLSDRQGRVPVLKTDPSVMDSVCSMNRYILFQKPLISTTPLPFVLWTHWAFDIGLMAPERNALEVLLSGVQPRGFSVEMLPFYQMENDKSYTGWWTTMATSSDESEIVYSVTPLPVIPRFFGELYNQPPICDHGVCIPQGDLIREVVPQSIVITTGSTASLPNAETVLVGELNAIAPDVVYDVPQNLLSVTTDPTSQMGKVTYWMCNLPVGYNVASTSVNPQPCNLAEWEDDHPGNLFRHSAPISAGEYRHTITDGRCDALEGKSFNFLCDMLDHYTIHSSTNMRDGSLVVVPDEYTYTVGFHSVNGPAILRVQSGCPEVSFDPNALTGRTVYLTNSLPYTIRILATRTNTDPSCPQQDDYVATMDPKEVNYFVLPNCANYTVQVYRLSVNDALQDPVACGDPIVDALKKPTQQNLAISGLIGNITTEVTNELAKQASGIDYGLLGAFYTIITYALPSFNTSSIPGFDSSLVTQFSNISTLIDVIRARASGIDYTKNGTAVQAIAGFQAQLISLQAQTDDALNEVSGTLQTMIDDNAAMNVTVKALVASLDNLHTVLSSFVAITNAAIADMNSRQSNAAPCNIWCRLERFLEFAIHAAIVVALILGAYYGYQWCSRRNRDAEYMQAQKHTAPPKYEATTSGQPRVDPSVFDM